MNRGFIGVTDNQWFNFHRRSYLGNEVNFWRKNTNTFKAIEMGDKFFFLVKNPKGIKAERKLRGYGDFVRFEVLGIDEAWDKYRECNGYRCKNEFIEKFLELYGENCRDKEVGCIILDNIVFFEEGICLSELGIEFKNSIVSGKCISEDEVESILSFSEFDNILGEEEYEDYNLEFNEGKRSLEIHYKIERNPKIIKIAKKVFKNKNESLYCEICGFNFYEFYGDFGQDYIEGHHNKPLNKYSEGEKTNIKDIKMVCANCHRIIHRNNISFEDLKEYIKKRKY